jgi:hypothetical protein
MAVLDAAGDAAAVVMEERTDLANERSVGP